MLRELGTDAIRFLGQPPAPDEDVLAQALFDDHVLVTSDKGFGDLVFRGGLASKGVILFRLGFASAEEIEDAARAVLSLENFGRNAFTTMTPQGIRVRPIP